MAEEKTRYTTEENKATKIVVYFHDDEAKVKIKIKEVFKKDGQEVHYPFDRDYEPKYPPVEKIIYSGFGGQALPRGIAKSPTFGLGFTKNLSPVFYYLSEKFALKTISVVAKGENKLDLTDKTLTINASTLDDLFVAIKNTYDRHSNEVKALVVKSLSRIFPRDVKFEKEEYAKNTIHTFLSDKTEHAEKFSNLDWQALINLIDLSSKHAEIIETSTLIKTRETIEEHYIEDVIAKYKALLEQKTETDRLEDKWQEFFKTHSWIFSYVLSLPVILHEDQAYVGGKKVTNKDGKVTDFLVKNHLTNNVSFIEIKTHKTDLVKGGAAYRGTDVFSISSELTGSINQVLNQRDNFQKEFWTLKGKSGGSFETLNSSCVIVVGSIQDLEDTQKESFELFRSNSKDVLIITFDELLLRLEGLHNLMSVKV